MRGILARLKKIVRSSQTDAHTAGSVKRVDLGRGVTMDLVWIPPGTFLMGSPNKELGRDDDEGPQHQVTISSSFWMGKYPVTQRQYQQVMGKNPALYKDCGLDAPVETVNGDDVERFNVAMQKHLSADASGFTVRLPTEAEWEYACRAGTTAALYNGLELTSVNARCDNLDSLAWYHNNSESKTHAVGQKLPNAWGLHDMLGNVWEWCADGLRRYTDERQVDPAGPSNDVRVIRGGCWDRGPAHCRVALRSYADPFFGMNVTGFRVVLRPER